MKKILFSGIVILFLLLMTGADCDNGCDNGELPDLIVVKPYPSIQGPQGYCDVYTVDGVECLKIQIKNQGPVEASDSMIKVEFVGKTYNSAPYSIGPDITITIPVPIPDGVYNPDMTFIITADYQNAVEESDEGNNTAEGGCVR